MKQEIQIQIQGLMRKPLTDEAAHHEGLLKEGEHVCGYWSLFTKILGEPSEIISIEWLSEFFEDKAKKIIPKYAEKGKDIYFMVLDFAYVTDEGYSGEYDFSNHGEIPYYLDTSVKRFCDGKNSYTPKWIRRIHGREHKEINKKR